MLKSGSFDNNDDLFSSGTCSPDEDFIQPSGAINKINKKTKDEISDHINLEKIKIKITGGKQEPHLLNFEAKFADFFKVDNIYAQFLIDISQKCMNFDQEDRPTSYALWKEFEKFEQAVTAWNIFCQN